MGYTSRSHLSKYLGGNPVNDSLLGLKYVIDLKDSQALVNYYEKEFTSGKYDVYSNPYALSLAYGVSDDVLDFDFDKHSTLFKKLNGVVGAIGGYDSAPELFKPINDVEESYTGCTMSGNYINKSFTKTTENSAASVSYTFVATESAEYYFHTPSNAPKECLIEVNGNSLGKYLGSDTRHIFSLGWFEAGETVNVTIQLKEDPLNIIGNVNYVWYLDREVYDEVFTKLTDNPQWQINDDFTDDHLSGTITTTEESTMIMTTMAYDEGWQVYVDGEKVEIYQALNALIAFDIEGTGEHTLEMKYMPTVYKLGITFTIGGVIIFVVICAVDFLLKKTVRKDKTRADVPTYWVLEDFDEDAEQLLSMPCEEKQTKKLKEIIRKLVKNKENQNDENDKNNGDN